jgi:hypothetical protein
MDLEPEIVIKQDNCTAIVLYQELSKPGQMDGGVMEHYEALIREKDHKISRLDEKKMKIRSSN